MAIKRFFLFGSDTLAALALYAHGPACSVRPTTFPTRLDSHAVPFGSTCV